ncbi:MAG: hypothetical protein CUN56_13500 [Phototrophicales bacterium]|nr:MAG: hypothetical protein CUN56_13500 [Phototrophicales bacterium]RMG72595.1 MAG: hypothetical protein D6711_12670 [Chloroflexota bacterium]
MRNRLIFIMPAILIIAAVTVMLIQREPPDPEGFEKPTHTAPPFSAQVNITSPRNGTIIYAENLIISGTISDSPQAFMVQIVTPDNVEIARTTVDAQPSSWSIEIPTPRTDEPLEAEIRLIPTNGDSGVYDRVSVLLDDQANRPEGIYGSVTLPRVGMEMGGDTILVEGRVSGVESVTVQLMGDSTTNIISSVIVDVGNPYLLNDVPWQAEIPTHGYMGSGVVMVFFTSPTDDTDPLVETIPIVITQAAG